MSSCRLLAETAACATRSDPLTRRGRSSIDRPKIPNRTAPATNAKVAATAKTFARIGPRNMFARFHRLDAPLVSAPTSPSEAHPHAARTHSHSDLGAHSHSD